MVDRQLERGYSPDKKKARGRVALVGLLMGIALSSLPIEINMRLGIMGFASFLLWTAVDGV